MTLLNKMPPKSDAGRRIEILTKIQPIFRNGRFKSYYDQIDTEAHASQLLNAPANLGKVLYDRIVAHRAAHPGGPKDSDLAAAESRACDEWYNELVAAAADAERTGRPGEVVYELYSACLKVPCRTDYADARAGMQRSGDRWFASRLQLANGSESDMSLDFSERLAGFYRCRDVPGQHPSDEVERGIHRVSVAWDCSDAKAISTFMRNASCDASNVAQAIELCDKYVGAKRPVMKMKPEVDQLRSWLIRARDGHIRATAEISNIDMPYFTPTWMSGLKQWSTSDYRPTEFAIVATSETTRNLKINSMGLQQGVLSYDNVEVSALPITLKLTIVHPSAVDHRQTAEIVLKSADDLGTSHAIEFRPDQREDSAVSLRVTLNCADLNLARHLLPPYPEPETEK